MESWGNIHLNEKFIKNIYLYGAIKEEIEIFALRRRKQFKYTESWSFDIEFHLKLQAWLAKFNLPCKSFIVSQIYVENNSISYIRKIRRKERQEDQGGVKFIHFTWNIYVNMTNESFKGHWIADNSSARPRVASQNSYLHLNYHSAVFLRGREEPSRKQDDGASNLHFKCRSLYRFSMFQLCSFRCR